jgi:UPF0042 nucleotide-binding protein
MTKGRRWDVDVTVISGLSGAGRSEAAKVFEDLGWFVIDNLPPALIDKMLALALAPGNDISKVALVMDVRGGAFFHEAAGAIDELKGSVRNFRLLFLDASDQALVRRFEATRRRHPLAENDRVAVGIQKERAVLQPFKEVADLVINTTDLSVHELRARIHRAFGSDVPEAGLKTTVISFGFKYGLPVDADMVLDVRFLPNPHWIPGLREQTGLDGPVRDYVLGQDATSLFLNKLKDLLTVLLPAYRVEGRHYLTIAVGCTGGRHRSVVLAEVIAEQIRTAGFPVKVAHRDVERLAVAT